MATRVKTTSEGTESQIKRDPTILANTVRLAHVSTLRKTAGLRMRWVDVFPIECLS